MKNDSEKEVKLNEEKNVDSKSGEAKEKAPKTRIFYLVCILITEAVGITAGILTRNATKLYATAFVKPPLAPPPVLFPIAWTLLYALMGAGFARAWLSKEPKGKLVSLIVYLGQLVLNFCWCFIFFQFRHFGVAFFWLVALFLVVLLMTGVFWKRDRLAAIMQFPYVLWLVFAGYLNAGVFFLNQ
ncbi:MAG: tryptophan-rich sensory protein [Lachnospiraceae bacterium]|nr:tryptophan-rich sensory protein [Lachnospiraceae bacterium]